MNRSAAASIQPILRIFPAPEPAHAADPVPAMRRELALLRIELEQGQGLVGRARVGGIVTRDRRQEQAAILN